MAYLPIAPIAPPRATHKNLIINNTYVFINPHFPLGLHHMNVSRYSKTESDNAKNIANNLRR